MALIKEVVFHMSKVYFSHFPLSRSERWVVVILPVLRCIWLSDVLYVLNDHVTPCNIISLGSLKLEGGAQLYPRSRRVVYVIARVGVALGI